MILDFTQYPMGLLGGVVALVVFGIFLGTWWWYAIRVHDARALVEAGKAILVDIDDPKEFAAHPVLGARNIPLAELANRSYELGRQPLVVCGNSMYETMVASWRLRAMGYRVVFAGAMGA